MELQTGKTEFADCSKMKQLHALNLVVAHSGCTAHRCYQAHQGVGGHNGSVPPLEIWSSLKAAFEMCVKLSPASWEVFNKITTNRLWKATEMPSEMQSQSIYIYTSIVHRYVTIYTKYHYIWYPVLSWYIYLRMYLYISEYIYVCINDRYRDIYIYTYLTRLCTSYFSDKMCWEVCN